MTDNFGRPVVFGKNGQLARSFHEILKDQAVFLSSKDADFRQPEKVLGILDQLKPSLIINCSAYTLVDQAEVERDVAFQVNASMPTQIARWCAASRARLVHFSTDYVFDGKSKRPWTEKDEPSPINVYGESKWLGEKGIIDSGCDSHIYRTSWVYSEWGINFVKRMIELGQSRDELRVVEDQVGSPTYARDLATSVWKNLNRNTKSGSGPEIFHLAGLGATSWHSFASEIFSLCRKQQRPLAIKKLDAISTDEFPTRARRPLYSVLDSGKVKDQCGIALPPWRESLSVCLERLHGTH